MGSNVKPIKYRVELFDGNNPAPALIFHTEGGWAIEGDFLMVYSHDEASNFTKTGYRIPKEIESIETREEPDEDSKVQSSPNDEVLLGDGGPEPMPGDEPNQAPDDQTIAAMEDQDAA